MWLFNWKKNVETDLEKNKTWKDHIKEFLGLKTNVDTIKTNVDTIKTNVDTIKNDLGDLGNQVVDNHNDINEVIGSIETVKQDKQDKLIAGQNISINNNVISSSLSQEIQNKIENIENKLSNELIFFYRFSDGMLTFCVKNLKDEFVDLINKNVNVRYCQYTSSVGFNSGVCRSNININSFTPYKDLFQVRIIDDQPIKLYYIRLNILGNFNGYSYQTTIRIFETNQNDSDYDSFGNSLTGVVMNRVKI